MLKVCEVDSANCKQRYSKLKAKWDKGTRSCCQLHELVTKRYVLSSGSDAKLGGTWSQVFSRYCAMLDEMVNKFDEAGASIPS